MNAPLMLPDPYLPTEVLIEQNAFQVFSTSSGAIVGAANRAVYVPVTFPVSSTLYAVRFMGTNTTGNYDLGLYDGLFNRIASTGSTAMAAALQTLSLSYRVKAGALYYAALAFSSASGTAMRWTVAVAVGSSGMAPAGVMHQDTALPLPDPATPVFPLDSVIPLLAFGVR